MAELKDHSDRLEVHEREGGEWAWRLVVNHNIVATDHNQGYENRLDAQTTMGQRVLSGEFKDVPTLTITD